MPMPAVGSLGLVMPLLALCWREASSVTQFVQQASIDQDISINVSEGEFTRQRAILGE
jgi:hypothetical protein